MRTGWRYRIGSVGGVAGLSILAVFVANRPSLQSLFTTYVPLFWRLDPVVLSNGDLVTVLWVTAAVFVGSFVPLFKPRPRRILDVVSLAHKRVVVAGSVLAALGYFNWSHRVPRATLVMTCVILFVVLPGWFVFIRTRPNSEDSRAIIVGDDTEAMETVLGVTDMPVIGYVSPQQPADIGATGTEGIAMADGGRKLSELDCLGGLSRLDEVLVEHDIGTALLAFAHPDRMEFFGALDACYDHGVTAKVHRKHADNVLMSGFESGDLVEVDLEPWDPLDHVIKRAFDVGFALVSMLLLTPVMVIIAIAIKLEDGGPVLYSQERTATFGNTFTVYKFRSMQVGSETPGPERDKGRVTNVGSILRRTHLDEIPQLWSILLGTMSLVGPRAVWTDEETIIERDTINWRKRWFVKPGLTGLAQISKASSKEPDRKLRYDLVYIRRQSFWFDIRIVINQLWLVGRDVLGTIRGTR